METSVLMALLATCAPLVNPSTAIALVSVESGFNPHAIGVVSGRLQRQPRHRAEATVTAKSLLAEGWNFSAGLGQINVRNFDRLGLDVESVFDPCTNLRAMQTVLVECFDRTGTRVPTAHVDAQHRLRRALSCYYAGNFSTGLRDGYVRKVARAVPGTEPNEENP